MIKLIASDLDGTLLQNEAQELTPRAIELIRALTQKGVHFVAASGRQYANERLLFHEIKDDISYIAENGSLCIHQGKVISRGLIEDDLLTVKGPFLKIAFANMTSRRTTDCLKELQEKFSSEIKVVTSGNIWIDFIVPGCNKGSALRNLMDLFGITPEECVAFGDQYNDVEMLETVGMGYAMSNAAPGIAGHAKYITDSVEEVLEDILAGLDL